MATFLKNHPEAGAAINLPGLLGKLSMATESGFAILLSFFADSTTGISVCILE